jgi:hypothetical protein
VWNTDGGANWQSQTGVMSGANVAAYESSFQQDLNSDGIISPPVTLANSGTSETALLTNYMAAAFATPAGEGAGAIQDPQPSQQPLLAKPLD